MKQLFSGHLVREMRKQKGLTQQSAAEQMRVTCKTLYSWESGITIPSSAQLPTIAKVLEAERFEDFYITTA